MRDAVPSICNYIPGIDLIACCVVKILPIFRGYNPFPWADHPIKSIRTVRHYFLLST